MQRAVVVLAFLSTLFIAPSWAYAMPTIDNVIPHILMDTKKSWIPMPKKMQQKMHAEKKKKAEKQRKAEEKRFKGGVNDTVSNPQNVPLQPTQPNIPTVSSSVVLPPKQELNQDPAADVPIAPTQPLQAATIPKPRPSVPRMPIGATKKVFGAPRMPIGASTPTATASPVLRNPLDKPDSTARNSLNSSAITASQPDMMTPPQASPVDITALPNKINKGGIGAVGGLGRVGNPHVK